MNKIQKNPKVSVSVIVTLILSIWSVIESNSELFGLGTKTLSIIGVIVSIVSLIWNTVKPEESVFKTLYRHVGTRPSIPTTKPPKED